MRILLLLLLTQLSFGQIKGIVKDAKTGLPIPYVNIGIENKTLGFSADENGMFHYAKSDENQNLIFTAVGYKSFKINSENLPKEILLTENILVLPDLEVSPPKHKMTQTIGKVNKKEIKTFFGNGGMPFIAARYIPFQEYISKTRYLKTIKILTNSDIKNAVFNLRIFTIDLKGEPVEYYNEGNILARCEKGKHITEIDVSNLNIKFPETGLLLGVENFIIVSNKYVYDYFDKATQKKMKATSYEPAFGGDMETVNNGWNYYFGTKWHKQVPWPVDYKNLKGKYHNLAVEVVLSD